MIERCPICGSEERHLTFELDLYQVIARWLVALEPVLRGVAIDEVAQSLQSSLRGQDPVRHDRLVEAAAAAAHYIGEQIICQYERQNVAGHA